MDTLKHTITIAATNRWNRIDQKMQEYVNQGFYSGIVTLVYQRGRIMYENCSGMMDLEGGRPMRQDTIHRIYSMSKPITCVALMKLFE